jgi:hypothetical protein
MQMRIFNIGINFFSAVFPEIEDGSFINFVSDLKIIF